ncbi:hypothetical protein H4R19_005132 [Coemansia spiralis]|nr:hypothetical protein H4R19_005132 [Coemansia spiralis]
MESISIDMKSATFQTLARVVLPATKRLSLGISLSSGGDTSGMPTINHLLEGARRSTSLELIIWDKMLVVAPESITCTALTHLFIAGPVSVDAMLKIIGRLPRLAVLKLYSLYQCDAKTDISIPEVDEDIMVEPLSTSLKVLDIVYDNARHLPYTAVAVAKYALLRFPMLAKLSCWQTPADPVLRFVDAYTPCYPHLAGVEVRLYKNTETANIVFSSRVCL